MLYYNILQYNILLLGRTRFFLPHRRVPALWAKVAGAWSEEPILQKREQKHNPRTETKERNQTKGRGRRGDGGERRARWPPNIHLRGRQSERWMLDIDEPNRQVGCAKRRWLTRQDELSLQLWLWSTFRKLICSMTRRASCESSYHCLSWPKHAL